MGLAIISATPAFLALIITAARRSLSRIPQAWVLSGFIGALFLWLLSFLPIITESGPIAVSIPWVPDLGISISLYLDGLSLLFGLIIVGIGVVIVLYAGYYFEDTGELSRFYILLLAFMSAMLALVLAGNLITLFIAWESTSVVSFLLIGFNGRGSEDARKGALQALMITAGGGLALLVGLVLMGTAAGSTEISQIINNPNLHEHPWYTAFTILILLGCFSKSAQWPLHFWLPNAMSAPTPASAYLHSATMVKAGIYLLIRLYPTLGNTTLWSTALTGIGLITMLVGAVIALRQRDLKASLAYSTISQLGALVALLGLPNGEGLKAALVGILAHSLYKATFFLVAGAVDHSTGTRLFDKLGGLGKAIPGWATIATLAGLSMAGLPPLLGFVAKETLLDAIFEHPLALAIVLVSAACTVAMALILVWDVFMSSPKQYHHWHQPSIGMLVGPSILAGGSLLAGLRLDMIIVPLVAPMLPHDFHLVLFSGFNTPLVFSTIAILSGGAIFVMRNQWRAWTFPALPSGIEIYNRIIHTVEQAGDLVLRSQGGKLRYYLVVILCTSIGLQATAGLAHISGSTISIQLNGDSDILRGLLLLLTLGAMLTSIFFKNHLLAALSLGVAGYAVGGLFLLEPAPDVALVQFMVETVGTVLLIVMLARIRKEERQAAIDNLWKQTWVGKLRDITISVLIGAGVSFFALAAVTSRPKPETIATWHLDNALHNIGITDVVGAIVTDYRGMDTIIEISVFAIAALGTLTILSKPAPGALWPSRFRKVGLRWNILQQQVHPDRILEVDQVHIKPSKLDNHAEDMLVSQFATPLTRTMAQLMLPCALLIALAQLTYGGDGPGDGFTAGVISGLGVTLIYIVFGYHDAQTKLTWLNPRRLIGVGLALVIANAALPLLFGQPFLAHTSFEQLNLPANIHLSSTFIYETGIFLSVLGSISTVMEAITYPKEVEPL